MALSLSQTKALAEVLKPGMRVASMGYPDLIAPIEMLLRMLDGDATLLGPRLAYRADSAVICKRHGLKERQILDAHSFFSLLGCELDVYDIVQERGCEIILDLNYEQMQPWQYDIVLDVGTAEHCFNIAQAVMNMAELVKQGGYIIHENPHSGWGNHGFYSLQPTFFHDFYSTNGFEIIECLLVTRNGDRISVPLTQRFNRADPVDANIFCMAKRLAVTEFKYPTQSKYL